MAGMLALAASRSPNILMILPSIDTIVSLSCCRKSQTAFRLVVLCRHRVAAFDHDMRGVPNRLRICMRSGAGSQSVVHATAGVLMHWSADASLAQRLATLNPRSAAHRRRHGEVCRADPASLRAGIT